jgi:hypothetical protein
VDRLVKGQHVAGVAGGDHVLILVEPNHEIASDCISIPANRGSDQLAQVSNQVERRSDDLWIRRGNLLQHIAPEPRQHIRLPGPSGRGSGLSVNEDSWVVHSPERRARPRSPVLEHVFGCVGYRQAVGLLAGCSDVADAGRIQ